MEQSLITAEDAEWKLPSAGRVGMFVLIFAELAIFTIFIVAYAFYIGKSLSGPTAAVLSPPLFISACLLSSSWTMELSLISLERDRIARFKLWWLVTFLLGATFLTGTALEWHHLIVDEGLCISTNLFGTTFYSLVGLHGFHVTVGLLVIGGVAIFSALGQVTREQASKLAVISLYWHFVDAVWLVVFSLVYLIGR
ncbi:MAG: heme-copper oxidase subunit III [Pseudomonadota bacterium]